MRLVLEEQGILRPEEVARVVASQHRPNYILNVLSEVVKRSRSSSIEARTPSTFLSPIPTCFLHFFVEFLQIRRLISLILPPGRESVFC